MPELPQVQTVRRYLQACLMLPKPKKVKTIHLYYPNIVKDIDHKTFIQRLSGQTFTNIDRYGKHLLLQLKTNSIISHLRMTGSYRYNQKPQQLKKHDHIQFLMTDGSQLVYSDTRKFSTMHLVNKGQEMEHPSTKKLGPQATNSNTFSAQYILKKVQNKKCSIKEFLLDQQNVCGIGNIYADQILFMSLIHPERKANKISKQEAELISKHCVKIMEESIKNKGTTFQSFHFGGDETGNNVGNLKMYGRTGQPCVNCGKNITKIKVGGRGTHFCSKCQK